jgi:hypothetical protein
MFFLRGFKASRDIEAAFEQFIDDMQKQAANPKPAPPSPEQLKAQAETAKQQNENKRMQAQALIDQQTAKDEAAAAAAKHQMEMEKLGAEERIAQVHLKLEMQKALIAGVAEVHSAQLDAAGREHAAKLDQEAADQKQEHALAAIRAKPKPGNGASKGTKAKTSDESPIPGARKAPDGNHYLPDPHRPGKYLQISIH